MPQQQWSPAVRRKARMDLGLLRKTLFDGATAYASLVIWSGGNMTAKARGYKQAAVIVAVCICLFLAGFSKASTVKGGEAAPDFTLRSLHGPNLRLEEYRGKVVL